MTTKEQAFWHYVQFPALAFWKDTMMSLSWGAACLKFRECALPPIIVRLFFIVSHYSTVQTFLLICNGYWQTMILWKVHDPPLHQFVWSTADRTNNSALEMAALHHGGLAVQYGLYPMVGNDISLRLAFARSTKLFTIRSLLDHTCDPRKQRWQRRCPAVFGRHKVRAF